VVAKYDIAYSAMTEGLNVMDYPIYPAIWQLGQDVA
jgi:hypothetical protein